MWNVREWQSCSRKWALSQTPWVGSPHDSSSSQGQKLPTPPQPLCSETSKKTEARQTAFRDAMDVTQSPPMTWEDRVQEEEEEQERHSSTRGDSQPGPSSLPLEGCNVSDVSMAEEGPQQCDSDVIVEEEREESMETDAPLDSATPTLLKEKAIPEDLEAKVEEDHHSQMSEESTDQNPPMTLTLMRMSFWGHQPIFLFPGDTPMTLSLSSFPREMMTYECAIYTSKSMMTTMRTHGLKPTGSGSFEPTSPALCNGSHFDFVCSICINHVLFLNKAATTRSCRRAWGRVSCAARCPF